MRDATSPTPDPQPADPAPRAPTYRTGRGWVERGDGHIWVDPGSGAGRWRPGYFDDTAGCPRHTATAEEAMARGKEREEGEAAGTA